MTELTYDTRIAPYMGWRTPAYWTLMKVEQAVLAITRRGSTFGYRGRELPYVRAMYNRTWATERCVEVAIAKAEIERAGDEARVLEVGNVLAHYGLRGHAVVDKYEAGDGVRTIDVVDIPSDERYDLIVSLSTMEHVGWDETPRRPEKFSSAWAKLEQLLAPGGTIVVTVPVDWNEWLDAELAADRIPADSIVWLERTGRYCSWLQSDKNTVLAERYGSPYKAANGLAVLIRSRSDA